MDATTSSRVRANDFVTSLIRIIYIDEKKALDHTHIRRHYNELLSRIKNLFNKREGRFHGSRRFLQLFRLLRAATKPGYARIRERYVDTRVAVIQARSEYVADMTGVDPTHRIKKKSPCKRMIVMTSFSSYSIFRDDGHCSDERFPGKWIDRAGLISSASGSGSVRWLVTAAFLKISWLYKVGWQCRDWSSTWRSKLSTNPSKLLEQFGRSTRWYVRVSIDPGPGHFEQFLRRYG